MLLKIYYNTCCSFRHNIQHAILTKHEKKFKKIEKKKTKNSEKHNLNELSVEITRKGI